MLIVGAKGFAKEILEIFHQRDETKNLCFYDDVNQDIPDFLYEKFPVLKSETEAKDFFANTDSKFTIGIGNPELRFKMFQKFTNLGGEFHSAISEFAEIGSFGIEIARGCSILSGVKISNDATIGKGTMVYYNSIITHDVKIGEFCEISPGATLLGRCEIGNFVQIGSGAIIFPDVKIGNNSIVAAGAIVREDVPENCMVAGIPAEIKKNF